MNKIVKYLIITDLLFLAGWGFVEPIFAVFVVDKIAGATVATVGLAFGIYYVLKGLFQIPISRFMDRTRGEKDDKWILICGYLLAAVTAFLYIFITEIWQLYVLQGLYALSIALYYPSWTAIFTRHIDVKDTAFEWSLDSTLVNFAAGITAFTGGYIASVFGYQPLFMIAAAASLGVVLLLLTHKWVALPDMDEYFGE